jgi:lambda family phage minor tail protein L
VAVASDIQSLQQDALIELFELDLEVITGLVGDHYYFHAGTNNLGTAVVWKTKTYQLFAVKAEGFEVTTRGPLPRPTLDFSNVTGLISALARQYQDLIGARVIRRRTYAKYLDAVNFPGGVNPNADPNQAFPDDIFFVEKKISENKKVIKFELASSIDLQGFKLPARVVTVNVCPWQYRSAECSYAGSNYFDVNGTPVGTINQDVCGKSVAACKLRFPSGALPFGGFPAARVYKL